jgi:hypothetical protein
MSTVAPSGTSCKASATEAAILSIMVCRTRAARRREEAGF